MPISRRRFVQSAAAVASSPMLSAPFVRAAAAADPIKIAALYDLSGGLEIAGKPMLDTLTYAVEEINAGGGLLGRKVEVITYDPQTNMQLYAQYAQEAALKHRVAVVHGGITSASREVIRPVLDRYQTLYFYNTLYEGGVCDRNIFCTAATPGETLEILVKHGIENWGKKVYIVAADYNYGHITTNWVKKLAADHGGSSVGNEFFPLDTATFGSTISKIQAAAPDWVMSVLVGGPTISFYRQFAAAGLTGKIPMASTTFSSSEALVLSAAESNGLIVCCNYFEAIDNPANKSFQTGFRKRFGADYVPIAEVPMASYQGVHLWAEGVRRAGDLNRMAVIKALESGVSLDLPSGKVAIDPKTHHAVLDVYLAEFQNKAPKILKAFPARTPTDTSAVCDLAKNPNDTKQYMISAQ
jgi:urea transport system substrate-binding protein